MSYKANKQLIEYIPLFLREMREYKALFDAEDIELLDIFDAFEYTQNTAFIFKMDEYTISKYEELFNIKVPPNSSLQERRYNLCNTITNFPPFTYKWFIIRLDAILGVGNYYLDYSVKSKYFNVTILEIAKEFLSSVDYFLEICLPLNFSYFMNLIIDMEETVITVGSMIYKQEYIYFSLYNEPKADIRMGSINFTNQYIDYDINI